MKTQIEKIRRKETLRIELAEQRRQGLKPVAKSWGGRTPVRKDRRNTKTELKNWY
tara:strand:- start:249 stop:413 length:165 start_codon:yes stop_codon:yes gene_type:complete